MCVAVHYASGGPDAGDVLQEPHAGRVHQGSALSQSAAADGHVGVSRGCFLFCLSPRGLCFTYLTPPPHRTAKKKKAKQREKMSQICKQLF